MNVENTRCVLKLAVLSALLAGGLVGCSSTRLAESWHDPAVGRLPDGKVLAAVITDDKALRRVVENELVALIGPEKTTASYELLTEADTRAAEAAKDKVKKAGIDYALVMRPVSSHQETTFVPGDPLLYPTPYRSFGGYWGWGWGGFYDPGYVRTDTILRIETLLYSLKEDKVVWAGSTSTVNPGRAEDLVLEIARAATKDLRKKGLIASH